MLAAVLVPCDGLVEALVANRCHTVTSIIMARAMGEATGQEGRR